jgi:hypothetical protein
MMLWLNQWGTHRDWLESLSDEIGQDLPQLEGRPFLAPTLVWLLEAFNALSRARPMAFGPGAVPCSEMIAIGRAYRVGDMQAFIRVMSALDDAWLMHYVETEKDKQTEN